MAEWWLVGGRGRRKEWSDVLAEVKEGEAVDGCEEVVRGERWWVLWEVERCWSDVVGSKVELSRSRGLMDKAPPS